jgi:hypothetical protein
MPVLYRVIGALRQWLLADHFVSSQAEDSAAFQARDELERHAARQKQVLRASLRANLPRRNTAGAHKADP